jgi:hypothetical protein
MDSKSPLSDTAPAKLDKVAPIAVTTTAHPENVTMNMAIPADTEWKITIQNSDGTKNEVILSPVSPTTPTYQEIRIVMPSAKVKGEGDGGEGDGGEAENAPKTEEVNNSKGDITHLYAKTYIVTK